MNVQDAAEPQTKAEMIEAYERSQKTLEAAESAEEIIVIEHGDTKATFDGVSGMELLALIVVAGIALAGVLVWKKKR